MTNLNHTVTHGGGLGLRLSDLLQGLFERIATYRLYVRTLSELNALNDRELADLGIARCDIRSVARESVYGA